MSRRTEVLWQCKCGYLVSQNQYSAYRHDFMCSRCNQHRLSSFEMKTITVQGVYKGDLRFTYIPVEPMPLLIKGKYKPGEFN